MIADDDIFLLYLLLGRYISNRDDDYLNIILGWYVHTYIIAWNNSIEAI